MEVRLKRVYDPESPGDGFRVLVDKLWPRGIRKEAFHYDLWAKRIAPSTSLRVWYHGDPAGRWAEFRRSTSMSWGVRLPCRIFSTAFGSIRM